MSSSSNESNETHSESAWHALLALSVGQVTQDDKARDFLHVARLIASNHDAALTMLVPLMDPQATVSYVGEGASTGVIAGLIEAADQENTARMTAAKDLFDDMLAGLDRVHLKSQAGREGDVAASAALYCDLALCQTPSVFAEDNMRAGVQESVIEAILFDSGHPVLAVPAGNHQALDHVLIVWNGRAEAARAISAAMPLLRRAAKVSICRAEDASSDQVQVWLANHGIEVACAGALDPDHGILEDRTGAAILAMADRLNADCLVMGAYVHSRLRQLFVGGATRTVLKKTTKPVLLAH